MRPYARLFFAAALALAPGIAVANDYPSKPVKILVGFGAGSTGDITARIVAEELTKTLEAPFVVENVPGAGATIAMKAIADADPDGYTLLLASSSYSAAPFLFKSLPYDPYTAFTPIASISNIPLVVAVEGKSDINSVEDLRTYAAANPGPIAFAFGNTVGRLLGADFMKRVGLEGIPVSFNSVPQASVDVLGGRIPLIFSDLGGIQALLSSGDLKVIAVATEDRVASLPDVQTYGEAGIGDFGLVAWGGIVGPAGLDEAVTERITAAVMKSFESEQFRKRITDGGSELLAISGDEFKTYLDRQFELWKEKVAEAGIQAQ